jgi:SAM-dependent methyltransferase
MTAVSISSLRPSGNFAAPEPASITIALDVTDDIVFDPDVLLDIFAADATVPSRRYHLRQQLADISWLPRGNYEVSWTTPAAALPAGPCRVVVSVYVRICSEAVLADRRELVLDGSRAGGAAEMVAHWHLRSTGGTPAIDSLAWSQGHSNWFYKHFDHAAKIVISYMLGDSPLLRGRILDVGCGEGITDLGIAMRQRPQLLIGIDPFRGFERLPGVLNDHALGHLKLPECLRFEAVDANFLPYADDSFDVVISWGSLEHVAGGYLPALREIKRVLRPDGLFFVHPGLYYSNWGHHLGEFCNEPFFHLTKSHDELRDLVLSNEPKYIDRAGEFASSAQYWQWFNELNKITVPQFENELRALEFDFWRVALRTEDLIEYTPKLQGYRMQDLATAEVYLSCINRKKRRPG